MKKILLFISITIIMCSCSLFDIKTPTEINLVTIALDYKNAPNINNLYGTINDAKELNKALSLMSERNQVNFNSHNFYQIGIDYSNEYISQITYPSKYNIIEAIKNLNKKSSENSINIIYFSGHSDSNGNLLLATTNTNDGSYFFTDNDTICENQTLSVDELYDNLNNTNGKFIIISDSCYSGSLYKGNSYSIEEEIFTFNKAFENLFSKESKKSNIYILSATEKDNTAHEPGYNVGNRQHGYFTKALLEGLGWCDGEKGTLSSQILPDYTDKDGIQGVLAEGDPPAINKKILSIDSLYEYIIENQEINLVSDSEFVPHQYPCISSGRFDVALFTY
ncbi:MAG: caspase family protein [Pleomorphochaeta sp.]